MKRRTYGEDVPGEREFLAELSADLSHRDVGVVDDCQEHTEQDKVDEHDEQYEEDGTQYRVSSAHQTNVEVAQCNTEQREPYHNDIQVQGGPKILAPFLYALTLPNINRFLKLFHCQNQEKICSNTITKDPSMPQVCRYTTL